MSSTTPNLGLFKYNTSTDGKEVFSIQTALNNNWDIIDERCGSQRNIGEIVASTIPLTDAWLHPLNGTLISGSGVYRAFVTYIAGLYNSGDYTAIFDTEANWQTSVSNYGVCGKFVYNSTNNTVRLPKYNSKIYTGGGTTPVIGNGMTLGLYSPVAIPSGLTGVNDFATLAAATNVLGYNAAAESTGPVANVFGVSTDSTKSGLVAQLSNITTSLDGYYYIVVATSTKTDIQVDIDEIATDLNGKADVDLNNCTKPHIVETYVAEYSGYRIWSDGFCEQWGVGTNFAGNEITLLQPYKDTKGTVLVTPATAILPTQVAGNPIGAFLSNSKIIVSASNGYSGVYWLTRGYIS